MKIETISLNCIIQGFEYKIENADIKKPLKLYVQIALNQTGNTGRPLDQWFVNYNDRELDVNKSLRELNIDTKNLLFISLKTGHGGLF